MNKLQWNMNKTTTIFIDENKFENVVCKMTVIFFRPQCVTLKHKGHNFVDIFLLLITTEVVKTALQWWNHDISVLV